MTRLEQITKGHIWQVTDINPDSILFEGRKTKCLAFIKGNNYRRQYKNGTVRLLKVIWEDDA